MRYEHRDVELAAIKPFRFEQAALTKCGGHGLVRIGRLVEDDAAGSTDITAFDIGKRWHIDGDVIAFLH